MRYPFLMRRIVVFAGLLGWCAVLLFVRIARSGTLGYGFLVWNLFLAVIPAAAAALFVRAGSRVARVFWLLVWAAFLPNAPYIVTDLIHLRARPPIPLWFDVVLLASMAATGLLLGYSSVADVHRVVARKFGDVAGWSVAFLSLFLSGLGIYFGRFLRWNSWDLFVAPTPVAQYVASGLAHPLQHPRAIAVTAIYGMALCIGYVALQLLSGELHLRNERAA